MASITEIADEFFVACETGKGWNTCKAYCTPNATFAAQAEPLADVKSLQQYCDWMKGLLGFIPDGRYELVSFATDEKRRNVSAYAVFPRHAHRPRRTGSANGQEGGQGLCLRHAVRRR